MMERSLYDRRCYILRGGRLLKESINHISECRYVIVVEQEGQDGRYISVIKDNVPRVKDPS